MSKNRKNASKNGVSQRMGSKKLEKRSNIREIKTGKPDSSKNLVSLEKNNKSRILKQIAKKHLCLWTWNNPVGAGVVGVVKKVAGKTTAIGRYMSFGLKRGSADEIGIYQRIITLEDVQKAIDAGLPGLPIGQFLSLEFKQVKGGVEGEEQHEWCDRMNSRGAAAGFIRSVEDVDKILSIDHLIEHGLNNTNNDG